MFHLLWMLLVGIVVGFVARMILPGNGHMGVLLTGLLGVGGSVVGGLLARLIHKPADGALFHPAGFILSVLGSVGLLFAWHHLR